MAIEFDHRIPAATPPLDVSAGYAAWAPEYDRMLTDTTDGPLLTQFLTSLPPGMDGDRLNVADLGCGTGRNVNWLQRQGLKFLADGIDLSPAMLEHARAKNLYRTLVQGDIAGAPFAAGMYDLALNILVACHLPALEGLYRKAAALLKPGGTFWLIDMHPELFFAGQGTSVPLQNGTEIQIKNFIHTFDDHRAAGQTADFTLAALEETVVPAEWGAKKKFYAPFIGKPFSFGLRWVKRSN